MKASVLRHGQQKNPEVTESFHLLFRGMEITTGGQRVNDYSMKVEKMLKHGMSVEKFSDFLMAHKYWLPPHGGIGVIILCNISDSN